ncbi:MAG: glycoside hydrolase family 32 protein [candidate division WOR-3 bacterium]|nr:glycoside hydrolase family 32 protein [candidate division WOR-3 bacterium]
MVKKILSIGGMIICFLFGSPSTANDILIADFEGNDYGDWEVRGEAFTPGPSRGALVEEHQKVTGFKGRGLVNTFSRGRGTLTSPDFKIQRGYINFLIGGSFNPTERCLNLLVDGEVVRTATGRGDRRLAWSTFDVSEFQGKMARIRIVDWIADTPGYIAVDQIVQSDKKAEVISSRRFLITKQFLNLPVKDGGPQYSMQLVIGGDTMRDFYLELAEKEPDLWVFLDVGKFKGDTAALQVNALSRDSKVLEMITHTDNIKGRQNLYKEKYRPQFHFSSRRGWNNDPNGLVYYKGEYHLFYQHNPYGIEWGNMTWGHAISRDLIHWKELSDAIHPDALGTIFSGSAVVDWNNTSGFQTGEENVLVAFYTSAGSLVHPPKPFTQSIAYSNDLGRRWIKYEKNPVLPHLEDDNRDPKVIYHEPTKKWILALYLSRDHYALFGSTDLKEWKKLSDVNMPHTNECPDFFPLPVDEDLNHIEWVFWGANGNYRIGNFDGITFKPETKTLHSEWGESSYASQTWSDIPSSDGRRLQIAWLRSEMPPKKVFNQQMSFPRCLTLKTTSDGIRLFILPVREIKNIHGKHYRWSDLTLKPNENPLSEIQGEFFDIQAEIELKEATEIGLNVRGVPITYDVKRQKLLCGEREAPLEPTHGRINLQILVDRNSIEIFGNQGRITMTFAFPLDPTNRSLNICATGGVARVESLNVYELQSIWKE